MTFYSLCCLILQCMERVGQILLLRYLYDGFGLPSTKLNRSSVTGMVHEHRIRIVYCGSELQKPVVARI